MQEEIKEITDELKETAQYDGYLYPDKIDKLLDYITNLQQENNDYNSRINALNHIVNNLQEENKKVHKDFDELSERYFFTKSRNEKAIEFVNEFIQEDYYEKLDEYITHFTWNTTKEDLLNILQGVDKE